MKNNAARSSSKAVGAPESNSYSHTPATVGPGDDAVVACDDAVEVQLVMF